MFGALATLNNRGWGIGPLLGSSVVAAAGIHALFLAGAIACAAVAVTVGTGHRWFVTYMRGPHPAVVLETQPEI